MEALEQAAYERDVYENDLDVLLSMHKECGDVINWRQLLSRPEPKTPLQSDMLDHAATLAFEGH
ncbi:hypothetical protein [Pseudomonas sp. NBRC 111137]|uniref:hypothetical protein n=1 Tax=Pseudomonas sp. NBRC 111137 TaxID=1661052 RepID=UPI0006D45A1B|nr:hypothetical protein [Pseudomonas sp. NBRC 111137]